MSETVTNRNGLAGEKRRGALAFPALCVQNAKLKYAVRALKELDEETLAVVGEVTPQRNGKCVLSFEQCKAFSDVYAAVMKARKAANEIV